MPVEWVAGSSWNQWPDVHGMGGRMPVESAPRCRRRQKRPRESDLPYQLQAAKYKKFVLSGSADAYDLSLRKTAHGSGETYVVVCKKSVRRAWMGCRSPRGVRETSSRALNAIAAKHVHQRQQNPPLTDTTQSSLDARNDKTARGRFCTHLH